MKKIIYLDCDGTWIDLYGVEDWLDYLLESNPYPYMMAKPLVNLSVLARTIHKLQANGIEVGIISWLAKNASDEYNEMVTDAKMKWFKKHVPSVVFDEIHIVEYGTPKSTFIHETKMSILFDDEEKNRTDWVENGGVAYDETDLIRMMKNLLNE